MRKFLIKFLLYSCLALGCLPVICIFIIVFTYVIIDNLKPHSFEGNSCIDQDDKLAYFYKSSGFKIPPHAKISLDCDDHGGFRGDGEYYVVFETTAKDINSYLKSPFWTEKWQHGPVPEKIAYHTELYNQFPKIYKSPAILYLAQNRFFSKDGSDDLDFRNGTIIVIDKKNNRVFYSQWDW